MKLWWYYSDEPSLFHFVSFQKLLRSTQITEFYLLWITKNRPRKTIIDHLRSTIDCLVPGVIKCGPICQQLWPQMNGRQLQQFAGWIEHEEGNPSIMVIAFVWSCMRPKFIAGLPETWGKPVEPAASLLKSGVKGCSGTWWQCRMRGQHWGSIIFETLIARIAWFSYIQLIYLNFFSILDNSLVSGGKSQIICKVARFCSIDFRASRRTFRAGQKCSEPSMTQHGAKIIIPSTVSKYYDNLKIKWLRYKWLKYIRNWNENDEVCGINANKKNTYKNS